MKRHKVTVTQSISRVYYIDGCEDREQAMEYMNYLLQTGICCPSYDDPECNNSVEVDDGHECSTAEVGFVPPDYTYRRTQDAK